MAQPASKAGKEATTWYGGRYDPATVDLPEIKAAFAELARPAKRV